MLGPGWQRCNSSAVEAARYLPERGLLQVLFVEGRLVYDYPCTQGMYERFLRAASKGRFVNEVLKPYAQQRGWRVTPYPWAA